MACAPRPGSSTARRRATRLDVALHGLRLFKSRSQAQAAILDGRVLLNGRGARPGHETRAGDRVTLLDPGGARTLEILALPSRSLSREAARALVRDAAATR